MWHWLPPGRRGYSSRDVARGAVYVYIAAAIVLWVGGVAPAVVIGVLILARIELLDRR